jgi:hypothetical protein
MIEIVNRWTRAVIFSGEYASLKEAVEQAVRSRANLSEAYLSEAYLSGADLSGANLSEAYLSGADLSGANLSEAYLSRADLSRADLSRADLSRADLSRADLSRAYLSGADLSRADLSRADLSRADLSRADLSRAILPGFPATDPPKTRAEAITRVRDWFKEGHWLSGCWISTPNGAYAGDCLACLHGGIAYLGGEFGPDLSRDFSAAGYTVDWNDQPGRTMEEVVAACDAMLAKEEVA